MLETKQIPVARQIDLFIYRHKEFLIFWLTQLVE
jgi:hypothetical protein